MNSLIMEKLSDFSKAVAQLFGKSGLNKIITKVHNCFSGWWENSGIISLMKNDPNEDSLLRKIMYFPVSILEFLKKKTGKLDFRKNRT